MSEEHLSRDGILLPRAGETAVVGGGPSGFFAAHGPTVAKTSPRTDALGRASSASSQSAGVTTGHAQFAARRTVLPGDSAIADPVNAHAVMGYSSGEPVATTVAGASDRQDADRSGYAVRDWAPGDPRAGRRRSPRPSRASAAPREMAGTFQRWPDEQSHELPPARRQNSRGRTIRPTNHSSL